jgi:hypothetical protein
MRTAKLQKKPPDLQRNVKLYEHEIYYFASFSSVADPDPYAYVFGPPGYVSTR